MMERRSIFISVLSLLWLFRYVRPQESRFLATSAIRCSTSNHCPPDKPCCSQFGECGLGSYCVGGCNPRFSWSPESCLAQPALLPVTKANLKRSVQENTPALLTNFRLSGQHTSITGKSPKELQLNGRGVIHFSDFLISPNTDTIKKMLLDYSFTYSGFLEPEGVEALTLGMPKNTSGSLLSSTSSFLYGRSTVRMKTSRGNGVITAMILISAIGDEIDFEFVGNDLFSVQANYFHQGILDHTRMQVLSISSNSFENFHTYEIDWNPDRIEWIVDGIVRRTLLKADTWNEEKKIFEYPQTPMRLQISLWPGGAENSPPGTINWAGGYVDWENAPDIIQRGQFYATVESVSITPYENKFWPEIVDGLNKRKLPFSPENLINITYDYDCEKVGKDNWGENSIKWNFGPLPHLATQLNHGMNTGVFQLDHINSNNKKKYRLFGVDVKPKKSVSVDLNHDFIQDSTRLLHDSNGNLYIDRNHNTISNMASRSHPRNPLAIPFTYFPLLLTSMIFLTF